MKFKFDWTVVIKIFTSLIECAVFLLILSLTSAVLAFGEYFMNYGL